MKIEEISLDPGLYLVATPLGNARDITLRALDILASADVLAAEDTRTLKRLMQMHGVTLGNRQVLAYHDHNGAQMRPKLLSLIAEGRSVAYASEAGTPLVADPGYVLAREAIAQGLHVTGAPGPSAVVAGLTISGLPSDRFLFCGFPPAAKGARQRWLAEVLAVPATLAIYETPKKLRRLLEEMRAAGAGARQIAICREITKRFEEVRRGSVEQILAGLDEMVQKGEIVLMIDRDSADGAQEGWEEALLRARLTMSVKDAVKFVAEGYDVPRRVVYQAALKPEEPE